MAHDEDNLGFAHGAEPLGADFEPVLREVDVHLCVLARSFTSPEGLVDRVFEASAAKLQQRVAQPRLRLVGAGSRVFRRTVWGQLAMAACVGIAVLLFAQMPSRVVTPRNDGVVVNANGPAMAAHTWYAADAVDAVGREVGFLLETGNLESYEDVAYELSVLVADHGM